MTLLHFGDSVRSAELFHEVPVAIIDPFLWFEHEGRARAVLSSNESGRVRALLPELDVVEVDRFGRRALLDSGMGYDRAEWEVALRACREFGITAARVPGTFPLGVAEHLRAGGVELTVDLDAFAERRRVKSPRQLEGIRRAQRAADAAMGLAARLLRDPAPDLTCESIRSRMKALCEEMGCELEDDVIVARKEQAAMGHESGSGSVWRGDLVLVDIWPRDKATRCYADMTRTFVAGGAAPDAELDEYWRLCREALERTTAAVRPGVTGRELYDLACEVFEAAGKPTQRTAAEGQSLEEGFFHGLGHGVGIEVHEAPSLGLSGEPLVAGDVITLEPGCYRQGYGGCRLEDLVLVTEEGGEVLTDFPYELAP